MIAVRTTLLSCLMFVFLNAQCSADLTIDEGFNAKLNCIRDATNPSDGLCFLDMSYSAGLDLAGALAAARIDYPTARAATPEEFDHMFLAAGIRYNFATTASDAFERGPIEVISSSTNYDGGTLATTLGPTSTGLSILDDVFIFTDPDGSAATFTTRDVLFIGGPVGTINAQVQQQTQLPPVPTIGHLLVRPAAIPEPSAFYFLGSVGLAIALFKCRQSGRHDG